MIRGRKADDAARRAQPELATARLQGHARDNPSQTAPVLHRRRFEPIETLAIEAPEARPYDRFLTEQLKPLAFEHAALPGAEHEPSEADIASPILKNRVHTGDAVPTAVGRESVPRDLHRTVP